MSLLFSDGELNDMRAVQEAHMMDTCLIAEPAVTTNEYNLPNETFDWDGAEQSPCGFDGNPSKEVLDQVPTSEAVMRLPIDLTVSSKARVRIIKRFGERQDSPATYEVIGESELGPSGQRVWLRKVTDGSDG
jgi:hypothetical protein